ncbi:hypothetical protein ACTFIR_007570 [Dictyostelium discoideum]
MSYNNLINPVYLIHDTHEVQLEYLRSILDSNILALLNMVVPDWLQTDVAIKLNTQIDITECGEAITERRPSDSASNTGEKFPMKKNLAVPNHNSHSRNSHDAQAEKIGAETFPKLGKELTLLDDTSSQVYPVRHLATYLRASKGRRKPHSGDSVFIQNEGKPLDVKEINIIVLSTLSSSGIDISKFKSHSTRSAMASLLLSNNVPFHVIKKMGRWKSKDTVDTFYDKRIIGEKSGGFLNTVVQIS